MNHTLLADVVRRFADDLADKVGLTRQTADRIACRAELEAEKADIVAQDEDMFLREYREVGPVVLSEIMDCHRDTLRRRFNAANAEKMARKFGM